MAVDSGDQPGHSMITFFIASANNPAQLGGAAVAAYGLRFHGKVRARPFS
jgi:hypothetical protein